MGTMHITLSPLEACRPGSLFSLWRETAGDEERGRDQPGRAPATGTAVTSSVRSGSRGTLTPIQKEASVVRHRNSPGTHNDAVPPEAAPERSASTSATAQDPARAAEQEHLRRLVIHCLSGDGGAWQQLVASQHRRIYGMCYRFTGSSADAEDLTQEVFLKLYRALGSFDPAKGGFQTWIATLTRNLLVDHFRRTRQERVTESLDVCAGDGGDGPTRAEQLPDLRRNQHDGIAQLQLRAHIQHALQQVSPELREAVILRDLQDLDYRDIAAVLSVPEGTVKSRISRGRGELARILQREGMHGHAEGKVS